MKLNEKDIARAIEVLKKSDSFSVSTLAKELGVSRTFLYSKFSHLMPKRSTNTEEKIKRAILTLQAQTGRTSFTISEVASSAGITRQCISRDYKCMLPFIRGEASVDIEANDAIRLEHENKLLKDEIAKFTKDKDAEHKRFRQVVYSDLMKMDAYSFEANEDRVVLTRLQNQIDEMAKSNLELIGELAEMRSLLNEQEKNSLITSSSNSQLLCNVSPNYSALSSNMDESTMMKLFLKAEDSALKEAIVLCYSSKPDAIVFFQPFLSCEFKSLKMMLPQGKILVVESNHPQAKHFQILLEKLPNTPIFAVSAKGQTSQLAQYYCRKSFPNKFNNAFIDRLYGLLSYPELADGFWSVTTITPPSFLAMAK
ncbi:hypothetical protein [Vibrio splendidus]|uniref:Uncharacterized protein n=1 Tax=Vibrio splendidus TaxID=29497 RepID=A0A2T5DWL3_VIBSP|nr:hypothetical protein [Vibrio splendidus]OEE70692.1 hypothetical protein A147_01475 [Vibrio splendidus FF-6]PTP11469.1 hypothetical protein CWO36_24685 [Vibrio splendidus]